MKVAKELRAFLLADPTIHAFVADRIHQDRVPEQTILPYIWFSRSDTEQEDCLDDAPGGTPFRHFFDVEIICADPEDTEDITEILLSWNAHRGTFGAGEVQGLFVSNHTDDYQRRNDFSDSGFFTGALAFEVIPRG